MKDQMNAHELRTFSRTIRGEHVNRRREHRPVAPEFAARMNRILEATSRCTGVSCADILSYDRRLHITFARSLAMYLVREITRASYPVIGDFFLRDHSTVIHAHAVIIARMSNSDAFTHSTRSIAQAIAGAEAAFMDAEKAA
jgi:chromosomal replication initiation ATPase DnaA